MQINSKAYWENRFETDWNEHEGNAQTAFFAKLLCEQLPENFVEEVKMEGYSVCDMGCAEGDAIPALCERLGLNVDGMDFSETAIRKAKEKYPSSNFWTGDLLALSTEKKYDVVISSNVLEHFSEPWKVLENLTSVAQKYVVVMMPYNETLSIDEHMYRFSEENIPLVVNGFTLQYVSTVDGRDYEGTLYPDSQILLIYKKGWTTDIVLSSLTGGIVPSREKYEKELQELEFKQLELEFRQLELEFRQLELEFKQLEKEYHTSEEKLNVCNSAISRARNECRRINTKTWYKFFCIFMRIYKQLIVGTWKEKKSFMRICLNVITKKPGGFRRNDGYNMVLNIANMLETQGGVLMGEPISGAPGQKEIDAAALPKVTKESLQQEYSKQDVIFLSVIDYDFRFQRPQHFAKRFATNGHRVFYVNANFVRPDSVSSKEENLQIVDFSSEQYTAIYGVNGQEALPWMQEKFDALIYTYAIRDAVVVVDYPNWVYGAEYIREKYGFKVVTDYMDDYTGFLGTAEDFLKNNCIRLLEKSDAVIVSSQFLKDVAERYTSSEKITIIRNGTEVEHFYKAIELRREEANRKIVGYYGAVSHWFAWEKVCYLAKKFEDCDIVIVGEVTEHKKQLEKYSNIKLLGEKPYSELPAYLATFDVCLIPFDTSTDLIKATNPVKFYEYLSAGKKVVATEIPELEPFKDEYVYMSNDDEKFAEYVQMCLTGNDKLKDAESCISFARENDWQKRFERFADACVECVPMVSVIVLTYNNLELNKKCITSILEKTAYVNYELIIVDNLSTDGTREYLSELSKKNIPNVKVVLNEENAGFAGGNNLGIKMSNGEYVLLLNNDTVVSRGWLTAMVKHLENNPQYGMCNPVTNSIGNESMIAVDYYSEEEMDKFSYCYTSVHMGEEYKEVDRLPLFATLVRKSLIEKIGLLDESYKVGMFEDDDYTAATLATGYEIVIVEDAFIHHVNNAAFKKLDDEKYQAVFNANKEIYEKKWNRKWTMPHYREGVYNGINDGMKV